MTLLQKIKSSIDSHEVISFDIFDTLLLRPYVKPTDLFFHLEHIKQIWWFRDNRVKAEQFARQLNPQKEDITIDDIYKELNAPFNTLKKAEMDLEKQVLYPNPEMVEVFNYALRSNKKVIITSDMYLPQKFLEDILKEKGFSGYSKFYLSCKINKTKWSGSLYKYIINDLKIKPSRILHIGDNLQSDIDMAKKNGLSTYHYQKVIDRLLQNNLRAANFLKGHENNYQVSILLGILSIYCLCENKNYWTDFGFKYGGPVVYGYMQWLNQHLEQDGINEVMFVARDGYTLQKVFDVLKTKKIKTHYYYAPRIINLVGNLNYQLNMNLGKEAGLIALRLILSYFKDKDPFLKKNTPDIKSCVEGDTFIQTHKKLYEKLAHQECLNYQNYLKQFNLTEHKIGLVDTCSTLLSAQKSLILGLPNKNIYGYYWFTWEGTQKDIEKYRTSTFQKTHRQEFLDWNIMELYMTAPTPPADRIENKKVVFKNINPYEKKRIEIYPDLSKGIVKYAKFVYTIFDKYPIFTDPWTLIEWTNTLCRIPTDKDKKEFKTIQHAWDANHTQYIPLPALWFNQALKTITMGYNVCRVKLFNIIPLLKKKIKSASSKYYLFNRILIFKGKYKANTQRFKLFGFIPFCKIEYKETNLGCLKLSIFILGLPVLKVLKEKTSYNQDKTKVYLLNFRLLIIKKRKI